MKLQNLFPVSAILLAALFTGCSSKLDSNLETVSPGSSVNSAVIGATTSNSTMAVDLKSAANFGILSGVAITSTGFGTINGLNVGIYPGARSSVIGFPPTIIVNGSVFASDDATSGTLALMMQAKQDLSDAYTFAESAISPLPVIVAGDQGGKTLTPGIYKSKSTLMIHSGDLTLDAQGDSTAIWIFQVGSALTTVGGAGGNVILTGGAQAKNIFWQITSSATLGANTSFNGNLLALSSITLDSGAKVTGRVLARNGAVTLASTNIITKP